LMVSTISDSVMCVERLNGDTMKNCIIDPTTIFFEELQRRVKSGEVVQCNECKAYIAWEKIPDDDIITQGNGVLSFWGAPCEEIIIVGYVCPACTASNEF